MSIYKKEYFGIARKIVSNMTSESWEQIPHTAFSYEADVTEMLKYYHLLNEKISDPAEKITVNTLVLKIICEGLKAAPKMNTTLDFSRKFVHGTLNYHDNIDISMPITVAIDHRALDYGDCVPFFQKLDQIFEEPQIILNWAGIAADQSVINHEKEIKFEKQFEDSAIAV